MGYHRAGFDVVGVDINPQPFYPFEFHQGDALELAGHMVNEWSPGFDAIHASPPCQFFSQMSARDRGKGGVADSHLDLLRPTLALLSHLGRPYVVENVMGARRVGGHSLMLHGGMFGLRVHRPRLFWSNVLLMSPTARKSPEIVGVYGTAPDGRRLWGDHPHSGLRAAKGLEDAQDAMGMDWADWHGTKEAIPPAYTEFLGAQLLSYV
jgi:DNA (cytosine-5)-methyltransferase 1